ncbi:5407_t:CDS:1 [Acaulospora morrowiae]|uniref:5407_t:CDS:1 n=1 Tax=Acaulospora morrowiae TaxID=94023 RepID=A0A9N9H0Q3_9GLOM|nr:5407_t:CDS:1 [Acaulospora morrowiae]
MAPVRSSYNDISFIQVTPGQEHDDDEQTKKLRKATAMRNIVIEPLASVPFPPEISVDDLVESPKNSKQKFKSPNRFFIFRKAYCKEMIRQGKRYPQAMLSLYVGDHWKRLPEEQKEFYNSFAEKVRILFKEKYGAIACDDKGPSRSTNKVSKKVKKRQERKWKQPRHAESHVPQVATPPHTDDDMAHCSSFGAQLPTPAHLSTSTIENFSYVEQPATPMDDFLSSVQFPTVADLQSNTQLPTSVSTMTELARQLVTLLQIK